MSEFGTPEIVATGLRFPEGPVPMADGSVLLVEIARGTLTRVASGTFACSTKSRFAHMRLCHSRTYKKVKYS